MKQIVSNYFIIALILNFARHIVSQVFELDEWNFDKFTRDKDVMLVEFYAPWCHHCQSLAPEWEKAASALASNREFILGRTDCVGRGKTLCDRFNVQMFPMIKLFRHGVPSEEYNGERTAAAIISYVQKAQEQFPSAQRAAPPPSPNVGQFPSNPDPWAQGPSYQYQFPITTPSPAIPFNQPPVIPAPPSAPNFFQMPALNAQRPYVAPAPEAVPFFPGFGNTNGRQQQPIPEARSNPSSPYQLLNQNGNLFNNINDYLYRYQPSLLPYMPRPPPAATFQRPLNYPLPSYQSPLLNYGMPKFGSDNFQRTVADTLLQYKGAAGNPFQPDTAGAFPSITSPTKATVSLPGGKKQEGTFEVRLSSNDNPQGSTVFSFVDGKPFGIRRLVNRIPDTGPIVYSNNPMPRAWPRFSQSTSRAHIKDSPPLPSNTTPVNRYEVRQPTTILLPSEANRQQPSSNTVRNNTNRESAMSSESSLSPGRYVVSIKGTKSGGEASSIGETLSDARTSELLAHILQDTKKSSNKRASTTQINYRKPSDYLKIKSPSLINLSPTDRALIRANVMRPGYMMRQRPPFINKGTTNGQIRDNVAYFQKNAFSRLPAWFRPKLGPALLRYVVKLPEQTKSRSMLNIQQQRAGKRQPLYQQKLPKDLWSRIFSSYNTRVQGIPQSEILRRPIMGNRQYFTSIPQKPQLSRNLQQSVQRSTFSRGNIRYPVSKPVYPTPLLSPYQKSRLLQRNRAKQIKPLNMHRPIVANRKYLIRVQQRQHPIRNPQQGMQRTAFSRGNNIQYPIMSLSRPVYPNPLPLLPIQKSRVFQRTPLKPIPLNKIRPIIPKTNVYSVNRPQIRIRYAYQNKKQIQPKVNSIVPTDVHHTVDNNIQNKIISNNLGKSFGKQIKNNPRIPPELWDRRSRILGKNQISYNRFPVAGWNTRYQFPFQISKSRIPFRPSTLPSWDTRYRRPFQISRKNQLPYIRLPVKPWNMRYQRPFQILRKNQMFARPLQQPSWNKKYQFPFQISKKRSKIPSRPLPEPAWGSLKRKRSLKEKRSYDINQSFIPYNDNMIYKENVESFQTRNRHRSKRSYLETELSKPNRREHDRNRKHVWFQYQEW